MIKPRPALFKWRHFEPEIIVCAVRWYLRFSLSYQDVEELLVERGLPADHTTIWRWVQRYAPELHPRCRRELKPTNGSWRVEETYICQGGIIDRRDWRLVRFRRQNCFCNTTYLRRQVPPFIIALNNLAIRTFPTETGSNG